ncbi:MAG: hypothetical protein R6V85_12580 [Polyangia bacterium]
MFRGAIALFSILLAASAALASDPIAIEVGYRLVGEDSEAPEKARMVAEQAAAGVRDAGRECSPEEPPAQAPRLRISVAESGALYEVEVAIGDLEPLSTRFTGPFAGMLGEVRGLARAAVQAAGEPEDDAKPAPAEPPAEEEAPAAAAQGPPQQEREPAVAGDEDEEKTPLDSGAETDDEQSLARKRGAAWALTAAGGAALIAGVVLFAVEDPCVDETEHGCREYFDTVVPAIPLAGLGGVGLGLGIAGLIVLRDDDREPEGETDGEPAAEASLGASPLPGGAAVSAAVRF